MNTLSEAYVLRAVVCLGITTLAYFFMNGAQLFETAVIVPKWTAAPPDSFQLFRGKFGLDFKVFWIALHSIHEITFLVAIAFCWQLAEIRNGLLLLFIVHFAARAWTLAYFAPNIIEFQQIANNAGTAPDLLARAAQWRNLNYVRVGIFITVSLGLIPLLIKALRLIEKH
ncbi:transposase [Hymenobacter sp. M29]|uniref:Transposase n=1 Tax=Hymenobacter mellowenesis TaxID=3063995 RepID=A0ABT9AI21_9BACT|nr:transposase [Hymenobacter sp. M29]MDO7849522.1 transposase [Hymenobacter sp. M29]